jgi:hypothetical protein
LIESGTGKLHDQGRIYMDSLENAEGIAPPEATGGNDFNPAPRSAWRSLSDHPPCTSEPTLIGADPAQSSCLGGAGSPKALIVQAAHDLNSLLAVMIGFSELIQLDNAPNPEIALKLSTIGQAGERAGVLTRLILDLTRGASRSQDTPQTEQPAPPTGIVRPVSCNGIHFGQEAGIGRPRRPPPVAQG